MGVIIDVIILCVMALSIYLGYKKGLVGVAFKLLSSIAAIALSFILIFPISSYIINNTDFDDNIEKRIIKTLKNENYVINGEYVDEENSELPEVISKYINNAVNESVNKTKDVVIEESAREIARGFVKVVTFIILFIIVKFGLIFAKAITEGLAELPIIKQFNELGGVLYGALRGLVIIYAVFAIISIFFASSELVKQINDSSIIGKIVYNNNVILSIML